MLKIKAKIGYTILEFEESGYIMKLKEPLQFLICHALIVEKIFMHRWRHMNIHPER